MNSECRAEYEPPSVTNGNRATNRVCRPSGGLHDLGRGCAFWALRERDDLGFLVGEVCFGLRCLCRLRFLRLLGLLGRLPLWFWLFCLLGRRAVLGCIGDHFFLLNLVAVVEPSITDREKKQAESARDSRRVEPRDYGAGNWRQAPFL